MQLAEHRRAALFVEEDVGLRVQEDLVAALRQGVERDLVGHRARGAEDRRLLAEQSRRLVLQAVDGRVVPEDVVTDLGRGHRPTHLRPRLGDRVAAHVDDPDGTVLVAHLGSPFPRWCHSCHSPSDSTVRPSTSSVGARTIMSQWSVHGLLPPNISLSPSARCTVPRIFSSVSV